MLRNLADDGLFMHSIKPHSLDKISRHDFYATVFSTAMKNKWPQRAYIGLYSGPGRARIETTGEIIETTPMGAARVPDPFTHYIFVDHDERSAHALERRIAATGVEAVVRIVNGSAPPSRRPPSAAQESSRRVQRSRTAARSGSRRCRITGSGTSRASELDSATIR